MRKYKKSFSENFFWGCGQKVRQVAPYITTDSCYLLSHSPTGLRLHHHLIYNFQVIFSNLQCLCCQSFREGGGDFSHRKLCRTHLARTIFLTFLVDSCIGDKKAKPISQNFKCILGSSLGSTQTIVKKLFLRG